MSPGSWLEMQTLRPRPGGSSAEPGWLPPAQQACCHARKCLGSQSELSPGGAEGQQGGEALQAAGQPRCEPSQRPRVGVGGITQPAPLGQPRAAFGPGCTADPLAASWKPHISKEPGVTACRRGLSSSHSLGRAGARGGAQAQSPVWRGRVAEERRGACRAVPALSDSTPARCWPSAPLPSSRTR